MMDRITKIKAFFIIYFFLLANGLFFYLMNDHGDLVLWFAKKHNIVLNGFFRVWTHTGGWLFITIITIFILVYRYKTGLVLALAMLVQALVTYFFKQVLFPYVPRPISYFDAPQLLDLIEGVSIQSLHSFPSGHTMAAFTMVTFLSLVFQNKKLSIFFVVGGALTGISRMYLGQHFLIDTLAGSLFGVVIAVVIYLLFEKHFHKDNNENDLTPPRQFSKMDIDMDSMD